MKAYNRSQIEAERRIALKRDLSPYGCQFDGSESIAMLEELHGIIIDDPGKGV